MGVKEFKKDSFYINKIDKTNYSNAEREAIELYNYWDLKLYAEFNK